MDGISSGVIGGVTWGKIDASAWTEKLEPAREGDPERISKAVRERQRRQRRQTAKYMETSPGGSDRRPFLIEKLSPAKSQMEPIHHNGAGRTKQPLPLPAAQHCDFAPTTMGILLAVYITHLAGFIMK